MFNHRHLTVCIDMDGTLFEWKPVIPEAEEDMLTAVDRVLYAPHYYLNLNPYPHMVEFVKRLCSMPNIEVYIASCYLPDKGEATPYADKIESVKKHLPFFPVENIILIPDGVNKAEWVSNYFKRELTKDDILFDDYHKNLTEWQQAGGFPIKVLNDINNAYSLSDMYRIDINRSPFHTLNDLSDILLLKEKEVTPLEKIYAQVLYKVLQAEIYDVYSFDLEREELNEYFTSTLLPVLLANGGELIPISPSLYGVKYGSMTYFPLTDSGIKEAFADPDNNFYIRSVLTISPCEMIESSHKHITLPYNLPNEFTAILNKMDLNTKKIFSDEVFPEKE